MIRDVTEFWRAEVGCLWVDELESPVCAWWAARRRTGSGHHGPSVPHPDGAP